MYILGINAFHGDAAAALIKDGRRAKGEEVSAKGEEQGAESEEPLLP